jgi:outer membrane protein assembly factor BamB
MRRSLILFSILLITSLALSACTGSASVATSWPGITVDQNTLYMSSAASVYAINAENGSLIWRYPAKADNRHQYYSAPSVTSDALYVGDFANTFYQINRSSGELVQQFLGAKNRYVGDSLVVGDTILAPSADHYLYSLDRQFNQNWKFETKGAIWAQPISDGTNVYVASMDHFLYAVNLKTGEEIWKVDAKGAIVGTPVMDDQGVLYLASNGNIALAVESKNGAVMWEQPLTSAVWSGMVVREGTVYFGDLQGAFHAIKAEDGTSIWKTDVNGAVIAKPAILPEGLVVVTEAGSAIQLDFDGTKVWTKDFANAKLYTSPVVTSDKVIIAAVGAEQLLYALDFSGNQVWSYSPAQ